MPAIKSQAVHTVVALYLGDEISLGEGETYEYAMRECLEGIPSMYPADDVVLDCTNSAMPWVRVSMPLELARETFPVEV